MGDFGGGFPQQDHHRRGEVYLPSTTPNLVFYIVLAYRPVVYEAELCQRVTQCNSWTFLPSTSFVGLLRMPCTAFVEDLTTVNDAILTSTIQHGRMVVQDEGVCISRH